ncbi:cupredoxin domain-containing protein [Streptomyces sp. NPDC001070]
MTLTSVRHTKFHASRHHLTKPLVAAAAMVAAVVLGACPSAPASHAAPVDSGSRVAAQIPTAPSVAARHVAIAGFAFSPATLTVSHGTSVTWTNHDSEPHNVVGGPLHSPTLSKGASYSYTFTRPGTYSYICSIHPYMHGTVVVK